MDPRRMCPHCRAFVTNKDRVCPYCNERIGPRAIDLRDPSGLVAGLIPQARFNTMVILLVNFGLYLASGLFSTKSGKGGFWDLDPYTLVDFGAKYGPLIALGQWWRLVTAGFLHGGLLHILMNSWVFFDLGAEVEQIFGASRMWVIYLLSSICGFFVSNLWSPGTPSIGASAGLCGLIGAMIALGVMHSGPAASAIRGQYIRWAIYLMIWSIFFPGVDMAAHVGGMAGGFGIAYLARLPGREGAVERLWRLAAWFGIALTVCSFLLWYLWFRQLTP
ncbi:MAG TPA: rhomboid family intramembrane serine protease [Bryobacteraceae bacterium]|nr:rhomboid family intramembrane serine protease [Bryobacteraceae bacterium]